MVKSTNTTAQGTLTIADNAQLTYNGDVSIGSGAGGTGEVIMTGGIITRGTAGNFYLGNSGNTYGKMTVTGGTVDIGNGGIMYVGYSTVKSELFLSDEAVVNASTFFRWIWACGCQGLCPDRRRCATKLKRDSPNWR